jgi:hypothetical protein
MSLLNRLFQHRWSLADRLLPNSDRAERANIDNTINETRFILYDAARIGGNYIDAIENATYYMRSTIKLMRKQNPNSFRVHDIMM